MTARSVTLRGRATAERLMQDSCTVRRLATSTTDPDTGHVTETWTTIYTGKCKVQQSSPASAPQDVAEAALFVNQLTLHLPVAATGVQPDDRATIDASLMDPDLVGRVFALRGPAHKSYLTARRFPVVEVTG